ncbi:hypothetical protein [Micromonospora sp. WMMD1082]|uniref:hypothetical protein n=1 Tax=Micromonospora sp. WMMD1082 TaxID=3016104 RepID=UPI002417DCAD|nr:hypothetical protein [Micromonospora sp. WMMD1082]MDG4796908.1 hypothetical protein [Micromonospora sp. WMMD1082]
MGGRLTKIAILTLGAILTIGALGVFLFLGDIAAGDQAASIVAAILGLVAAAFAFFGFRRGGDSAPPFPLLNLRTEDEFLVAWAVLERRLREVAPIDSSQAGVIPMKVLLKSYERLPGVTESDIQDFLMLLNVRNRMLHPTFKGSGVGRQSDTQAISAAMLRQLSKLDNLQRGK